MKLAKLNLVNRETLERWSKLIASFFVGEGATRAVRMLAGFALVQWMAKDEYATFTLILAIRGTAAMFADMGFSGGLIALIGKRCNEPSIVGRYIAAAKFYRDRLVAICSVLLVAVFIVASRHYEWGTGVSVLFWMCVVATLWLEAQSSLYSPILTLQQRLKPVYGIDFISSLARLAVLAGLYFVNLISAGLVLVVGVAQSALSTFMVKWWTRKDYVLPDEDDDVASERKEAVQLTLPKIPGLLFYAVQGQVTIFIVGVFGQYEQIAEIGALGKLGMIFALPGAFAGILIIPWFAKLELSRVRRAYYAVMTAYGCIGVVTILLVALFPQLFLIILGEGYQSLGYELLLFSAHSTLMLLAGIGYGLTSARKWVYYWAGPTSIVGYILMLVLFLLFADLSQLSDVIMLIVLNSAMLLLIQHITYVIGYKRDSRAANETPSIDEGV